MPSCNRESWEVEETRNFLRLVRERQILKSLDGKRFRAEGIFAHLEGSMHDNGYLKIAKQMQTRFKTLRFQFNKLKRQLNGSGTGNVRKKFAFYKEINCLLGDRPVVRMDGIIDSAEELQISDHLEVDTIEGPANEVMDVMDENTPEDITPEGSEFVYDISDADIIGELPATHPDNTDAPETPTKNYNDEPGTSTQDNGTPVSAKKKRTSRSFHQSLENFANLNKENLLMAQSELVKHQQSFITKLFENQAQHETDVVKDFYSLKRIYCPTAQIGY